MGGANAGDGGEAKLLMKSGWLFACCTHSLRNHRNLFKVPVSIYDHLCTHQGPLRLPRDNFHHKTATRTSSEWGENEQLLERVDHGIPGFQEKHGLNHGILPSFGARLRPSLFGDLGCLIRSP